jgi:hypothetical protein
MGRRARLFRPPKFETKKLRKLFWWHYWFASGQIWNCFPKHIFTTMKAWLKLVSKREIPDSSPRPSPPFFWGEREKRRGQKCACYHVPGRELIPSPRKNGERVRVMGHLIVTSAELFFPFNPHLSHSFPHP